MRPKAFGGIGGVMTGRVKEVTDLHVRVFRNSNRHTAELEMPVTCTKQRLRHFLIATFGAFFVLHLSSYKLIFTL